MSKWQPAALRHVAARARPNPYIRVAQTRGALTAADLESNAPAFIGCPLQAQMTGGADGSANLGRRPALYDAFEEALGGCSIGELHGVKIARLAEGGLSLVVHFPPGQPNVHEAIALESTAPAGWWLENGEPAPGTPGGGPLPFMPEAKE